MVMWMGKRCEIFTIILNHWIWDDFMIYLIFAQPPCFGGWISIYIHLPTILAWYTGYTWCTSFLEASHLSPQAQWRLPCQSSSRRKNSPPFSSTTRDPEAGQELQYWPLRANFYNLSRLHQFTIVLPTGLPKKKRTGQGMPQYDGEGLTFIVFLNVSMKYSQLAPGFKTWVPPMFDT